VSPRVDPDEEWGRWIAWLGEGPGGRSIWAEITNMLAAREIWDGFAVVYNTAAYNNGPKGVTENPNFPAWIKNNYLDAQLMAVRRQLDTRPDVISVARLVGRVSQYPHVLSRDRYVTRTSGWQSRAEADQLFDGMVGPGLDHIDRNVARADLANLKTWTSKVVGWAHKEKAHYNESPRALGEDPTIGDLHAAVNVIVDTSVRYREMILGSSMRKRVALLSWTHIFQVPWLPEEQAGNINRTIDRLERKREEGEAITDEDFRLLAAR
jgi:hypothetical protein